LRLICQYPLKNCEAESSFSKLAVIKNRLYLRSTQIEHNIRLNELTIISILNITYKKKLSFNNVLDPFALSKSRKKIF